MHGEFVSLHFFKNNTHTKETSKETHMRYHDIRCCALDHSHPLSVLRGDDGHHERRRGGYFERREVDFLL